jgi:hypothetical protein
MSDKEAACDVTTSVFDWYCGKLCCCKVVTLGVHCNRSLTVGIIDKKKQREAEEIKKLFV